MAPLRSNIGNSLSKKRKTSLLKKIGVFVIFVTFIISICIWGLTTVKPQIKQVIISGNVSIPSENILKIANDEINKYYFWIIPTNNILLLRRTEIKQQILDNYKKIGSVSIYVHGIDRIEIVVVERESQNLWCGNVPAIFKKCYFMDSSGFIFDTAPEFSANVFPKYFGLISAENPIGQYYSINNFKNLSALYNVMKKISFVPAYFNAINEHEYEVYLVNGGKILINDKKSFDSSLGNLQALVDNNYIKTDIDSLKKIKYIDLRFGNKVNFELKTSL